MARNYYVILGVDPDATQDQIKSAYRRQAKLSHPDQTRGDSEPFRDVQEAYETLSDPARRRTYDDDLAHRPLPRARYRPVSAEPLGARECPVEPLIPTDAWTGPRSGPDRFSGAPAPDAYQRSRQAWFHGAASEVYAEALLTRAQALRGGHVRLWVPARVMCPHCWGQGYIGFYACPDCNGEGAIVDRRLVSIAFPAGVLDGAVARLSLESLGLPHAHLALRFAVRG